MTPTEMGEREQIYFPRNKSVPCPLSPSIFLMAAGLCYCHAERFLSQSTGVISFSLRQSTV